MNDFDQRWQKLATLARQAPAPACEAAPFGFSTRVAARAMAARPASGALLEKFALRGLVAALTLGAASLAFSFSALTGEIEEDVTLAADPLPELLELS